MRLKDIQRIKMHFKYLYSAILQDGPLYKEYSYSSYTRDSNEKVALKCLHNSQKSIDSLINEANKYPTNYKAFQVFLKYSIDFLINEANKYSTKNESFHIFNYTRDSNRKVALRCLHGSKNIVEFVINAVEKYLINTFTIWTDGPLHYNKKYDNYARDANKEVVLRCLHDSQNIIELVINEAKKYLTDTFEILY
ncbi:kinase-like domain-containing protein [Rhizophagus irregularis DAOM 181602=DAOM 197198]|nr:kinase-like domain-containing protein [Rhizophagus irregularis DAOM 181602=DAOM 197198]